MYDINKESAIEGIWSAYKKARAKRLPNRRIIRPKRTDIDNYELDKSMKSKYGKW